MQDSEGQHKVRREYLRVGWSSLQAIHNHSCRLPLSDSTSSIAIAIYGFDSWWNWGKKRSLSMSCQWLGPQVYIGHHDWFRVSGAGIGRSCQQQCIQISWAPKSLPYRGVDKEIETTNMHVKYNQLRNKNNKNSYELFLAESLRFSNFRIELALEHNFWTSPTIILRLQVKNECHSSKKECQKFSHPTILS